MRGKSQILPILGLGEATQSWTPGDGSWGHPRVGPRQQHFQPKILVHLAHFLRISVCEFQKERVNPSHSFSPGYLTHPSRSGVPPLDWSASSRVEVTQWAWLGRAVTGCLVHRVKWGMPSNVGVWSCPAHVKGTGNCIPWAWQRQIGFSLFSFLCSQPLSEVQREEGS